ncbi:hypothetical protein Q4567_21690 [Aliiglaciecola sp. 2_MG-2023]|uniref:hypothetical protein n=1 Tax=unclassified Aliiglaciecola TaxID=2593648 RepID=UPI0026E25CFC|nr:MULTISPECIES: hypothetical protein [unclassified Aliiglaciecola]MDO6713354.1 hypothetical protein [Aliiglaciecola sp. 2_MG-2023]MDO6754490.1 hypothetical protein [Aliiglaciecola sp. 1_MG-2023]
MEIKRVKIRFSDEDDTFSMREFTHFMYLFNAANNAFISYDGEGQAEEVLENENWDLFKSILRKYGDEYRIQELFFAQKNELQIEKIIKQSPLEMWVVGPLVALVAAVIISGGKVDLKNLTFEVNSLGSGLKDLLEAFNLPERLAKEDTKIFSMPSKQKKLEDKMAKGDDEVEGGNENKS